MHPILNYFLKWFLSRKFELLIRLWSHSSFELVVGNPYCVLPDALFRYFVCTPCTVFLTPFVLLCAMRRMFITVRCKMWTFVGPAFSFMFQGWLEERFNSCVWFPLFFFFRSLSHHWLYKLLLKNKMPWVDSVHLKQSVSFHLTIFPGFEKSILFLCLFLSIHIYR